MKPEWKYLAKSFAADGSLRDIYVKNINSGDWQKFLDMISAYRKTFTMDGEKSTLPVKFKEIKSLRETKTLNLAIHLNESIQLNCHFFIDDEIELDIDPRGINSDKAFGILWAFVENLGMALSQNVEITFENSPGEVITTFSPG